MRVRNVAGGNNKGEERFRQGDHGYFDVGSMSELL